MKKLFIFVVLLLVVVLAVAHFSRPRDPQTSLTHLMVAQLPQTDQMIVQTAGGETVIANNVGKHVDFKDRFFWIDAQADGKPIFIGAFGRWFPRGDVAFRALMDLENFKDKAMNEAKSLAPAAGAAGQKVKDGIQDLSNKVKLPGQN